MALCGAARRGAARISVAIISRDSRHLLETQVDIMALAARFVSRGLLARFTRRGIHWNGTRALVTSSAHSIPDKATHTGQVGYKGLILYHAFTLVCFRSNGKTTTTGTSVSSTRRSRCVKESYAELLSSFVLG